MKKIIKLVSISFFLLLTACASNNQIPATTFAQLEEMLIACQHAQVIQRGEYTRIILYKDQFFEVNTQKIRRDRFAELALIAKILKTKPMENRIVMITGHSDGVKSEKERLRESDIMARNVAAYLWAKGVPYQRMQVFGLSDKKPIATDDTPMGSAYNRRVEILVPLDALQ